MSTEYSNRIKPGRYTHIQRRDGDLETDMRSFDTNIHILTYTNIHTICPMHETVAEGRTLIKDLFCLGVKSGRRRITSNILGIESV